MDDMHVHEAFGPILPRIGGGRCFGHGWPGKAILALLPPPQRLAFRGALLDTYPVKLSVTDLTDQLMASYARVGGINHLDGKNLPSKTAIASISCDLLRLLFPGFFDEKSIHSSQLKVEITALMDSVLG